MRRIVLATLAGLLMASAAFLHVSARLEAAPPSDFFFGQSCTSDAKVNLNIRWKADPSARELWIDASSVDDSFAPDTFMSQGPFSASTFTYQWRGLDPHHDYWFRVNQLLPSGDWESNKPVRYILGCGNVAAPAGAKVEVTGFSDSARLSQTPPNRTLKACETDRLYVYTRISGLTELTDVTSVWYQGSTAIGRITSAWDKDITGYSTTASPPPGGFAPGPYTFDLWTGGDGTWKLMAHATITLAC